jgi:multisite-specific tRNA:(cytosine-C5)-methyltransferase
MYLVNDAVKAAMDATDYRKMRLVSAGVKLFGRAELGVPGKRALARAQETEEADEDGAEDVDIGDAEGVNEDNASGGPANTTTTTSTSSPLFVTGAKRQKQVQFRVLSEGLLALVPYLDVSKLVVGDARSLKTLLETYYPLVVSLGAPEREEEVV